MWSGNRPEPLRPLAHAAALGDLDPDTEVRVRGGLKWRLTPGDPLALELPGRTLTLPADTADAVRVVLAGPPVRVGDLPAPDADVAVDLVRRLLRDGVLVTPAATDHP